MGHGRVSTAGSPRGNLSSPGPHKNSKVSFQRNRSGGSASDTPTGNCRHKTKFHVQKWVAECCVTVRICTDYIHCPVVCQLCPREHCMCVLRTSSAIYPTVTFL